MADTHADSLTLADLEAQDPHARWRAGAEVYCWCPFPACAGVKRDKEHRNLRVNTGTGLYTCHRCHASGKLADFWEDRPPTSPQHRRRAAAVRAILAPPPPATVEPAEDEKRPPAHTQDGYAAAFPNSPAAAYLDGRGIPQDLAEAHGCGYCADWYGLPRVTFPVRDRAGELAAINGRACVPCVDGDKQRTQGPKRLGVFNPQALAGALPIITEAPIDALSLAVCGYPAAALIGTTPPAWLSGALVGRTVYLATDADPPEKDGRPGAGDRAATELDAALRLSRCERLRPPDPWKDWNAALCGMGREDLAAWLSERLTPAQMSKNVHFPTRAHGECSTNLNIPPQARELAPGARVLAWAEDEWRAGTVLNVWRADEPGCITPLEYVGYVAVQVDGYRVEAVFPPELLAPCE